MSVFLGAFLAIIATCLINYSNFIQKRELGKLPRIGSESPLKTVRAFLHCTPWLRAQGIQILGAWTHNVAVGIAPLSVVQPINASGVCLLVVLAITRLKEKPSVVDWLGIAAIISGVITLGVTLVRTPGGRHEYRPLILWFFIALMLIVSISSLFTSFVRKDERSSSFLGIGVGMMVGLTAVLTKTAWSEIASRWGEFKIAGFIFSSSFWMAIALTIISMVFFQTALQRGAAVIVVPLVTGFSNMIPIIVGFIAFREPFPTGGIMIFFRLMSILLIIGGATLLSLRKEGGISPVTRYDEKGMRRFYIRIP